MTKKTKKNDGLCTIIIIIIIVLFIRRWWKIVRTKKKRGRKYIYCHHVFPVSCECAFELTPSKENFAKIKKVCVCDPSSPSVDVIHGWHPPMTLSSMDDISPSMDDMDGETSSMDESTICGCHPWMEKCHPWMKVSSEDVIRGWKCHRKMSSVDESVIGGCHPWIALPSVVVIHGWLFHTWLSSMDDIHGWRWWITSTEWDDEWRTWTEHKKRTSLI